MNESAMTRTLLARIRQAEPDAFAWKITETINGGKPDVLYIGRKRTTWWEAKKCTSLQNPNPIAQLTELQKHTIHHLARLGQDVLVVGYVGSWKTVHIYKARAIGVSLYFFRVLVTLEQPTQHPLLAYLHGAPYVEASIETAA